MLEDHVVELLGAYVVGCLDEKDCLEVESHLEACEKCRRGLDAYVRVMDDLPLRIALSEPSPKVRDLVLERARSEKYYSATPIVTPSEANNVKLFVLVWMGVNILYMILSSLNCLFQYRRMNQLENILVLKQKPG